MMMGADLLVALTNTSVGLAGATLVAEDRRAGWLLRLPAAGDARDAARPPASSSALGTPRPRRPCDPAPGALDFSTPATSSRTVP